MRKSAPQARKFFEDSSSMNKDRTHGPGGGPLDTIRTLSLLSNVYCILCADKEQFGVNAFKLARGAGGYAWDPNLFTLNN